MTWLENDDEVSRAHRALWAKRVIELRERIAKRRAASNLSVADLTDSQIKRLIRPIAADGWGIAAAREGGWECVPGRSRTHRSLQQEGRAAFCTIDDFAPSIVEES